VIGRDIGSRLWSHGSSGPAREPVFAGSVPSLKGRRNSARQREKMQASRYFSACAGVRAGHRRGVEWQTEAASRRAVGENVEMSSRDLQRSPSWWEHLFATA
jgi:hypothetical protein